MDYISRREKQRLVIPEGETKIKKRAFMKSDIVYVEFPTSLKKIGSGSFANCKRLKRVDIPNGVECIESEAFADCVSLEKISIPSTVKHIENICPNCKGLKKVYVPLDLVSKIAAETPAGVLLIVK